MIEDKLSRPERLRLECLAQAVQAVHLWSRVVDPPRIVELAEEFERYVCDRPRWTSRHLEGNPPAGA